MEARLSSGHWSHPVRVATRFRQRLVGLRRSPSGTCLLIRARSVHGLGMDRPLLVVALDRDLTVIGSKVMKPNRATLFPRARYILEMPTDVSAPEIGSRLVLVDG